MRESARGTRRFRYTSLELSSLSTAAIAQIQTPAEIPLHFGEPIDEREFRSIQTRLALDFFKWDCQVGDVSTLFRQPLLIDERVWSLLKQVAENLAAELQLAEEELLRQPDLHRLLGMPRDLRSVLARAAREGAASAAVRIVRFDFHYTTDGWRISEVNSDVPGGYTEASAFTQMMADCVPESKPAGNSAGEWTQAMMAVAGPGSHVALLSAPGFLEDQQVTAFLASHLQRRGVNTVLVHHPAQLRWRAERATTLCGGKDVELAAIMRFYQGEWLAKARNNRGWELLFAKGKTPVANPGSALLTESKRFPLTWDFLSNRMSAWRALLPESCHPTDERWLSDEGWVLKLAFSNTGDEVHIRESMASEAWNRLCRTVRKNPELWIAQRRFQPIPLLSHIGLVYPCIGVYVINGQAAGAYARVAARPVVDYSAMDAAVLIVSETNAY